MKGAELWELYYKDKWMKDAYALANKLNLRPEDLSPVPEDGMYSLALETVKRFLPKGTKVLDAGAGTLDFAIMLAREGYKVIAVEINPRMLELGLKAYPNLHPNLSVVRANFLKFEARYEAVVMLNASWLEPLPEEWMDKLVITDAWWHGLKGELLVFFKGQLIEIVRSRKSLLPSSSSPRLSRSQGHKLREGPPPP